MRALSFAIFLFSALVAPPGSARADEAPVRLKSGPGLEQLANNCAVCHSLDYVVMNSPFLDARQWDAEVAKMVGAFGAVIGDADAKAIRDYLVENYGAEPPASQQKPTGDRIR
jgi:mono/diheme cytochrome c family protein